MDIYNPETLSTLEMKTLVLRYKDRKTIKEIAGKLNISINDTRQLIRHASKYYLIELFKV